MALGENPTSTPILDSILPTLEEYMPPRSTWDFEGAIKILKSNQFMGRLLNSCLTRQEIEQALEGLSVDEQKYLLFNLRTGNRGPFTSALER